MPFVTRAAFGEPQPLITCPRCADRNAAQSHLMIAAGVNAKALPTYVGHRSITTTLDRYGHLFPGSEAEAAGLLDVYLGGE